MTARPRVLVVDDEQAIQRTVALNLRAHGFDVDTAGSAREALERAASEPRPDLLVLDLNLPEIDGIEVIRRVREHDATPIIVLSVRGAERDKVLALDSGADDYLTKPFGVDELLARVRAALRRVTAVPPVIRNGDLTIDVDRREVHVAERSVRLTPTEFDLLRALASAPGRVLTDRALLQRVWGPDYGDEAHYLHVYVARLRKKLGDDPQSPRYILTEPGVGYRLIEHD